MKNSKMKLWRSCKMSEFKQISQIKNRSNLNKLFYYLRKFFITKPFVSPYIYMNYNFKDKSSNVFKVFYYLKKILYKFIYLLFIMLMASVLSEASKNINFINNLSILKLSHINIFFALWTALLFWGNYKSKLLSYDEFKDTLVFSFQIPFSRIYSFELKETFIDRVIYSIIVFAYIAFNLKHLPLAIFAVILVFFAMYFAESFSFILAKRIKRELNAAEATIMLFLGSFILIFFSIVNINLLYKIALSISLALIYIFFTYKNLYDIQTIENFNQLMTQNIVNSRNQLEDVANMNLASVKIDEDIDANKSDKFIEESSGYTLFNKIFLSRHRNLWYKPLRIQSIGILVFLLTVSIYLFLSRYFNIVQIFRNESKYKDIYLFITKAFLFFSYFTGTGEKLSQAYYKNADYSLLHYSFYRRKETIWLQYLSRVKSAIMMGFVPFIILASFGLIWSLSFSDLIIIDLLSFLINILVISLFFNLHYLFMYYIIQPFNAKLEAKSVIYTLAKIMIYVFVFNSSEFLSQNYSSVVLSGFFVIYLLVSVVLVRLFAHKTFVYKD